MMHGFNTIKKNRVTITLLMMLLLVPLWAGGSQTGEKVNPKDILKTDDWQERFDAFKGDDATIKAMAKTLSNDTTVTAYFAFWCHDSVVNVPPFIKIIHLVNSERKQLGLPPVAVQYYSLERKAHKADVYFVEEHKVKRVPTFIFYKKGKELGRIIENPKKSLTEDIRDMIQ